jgi:hypothetical protein
MGDHVAAFDEQFAVERNADRPSCGLYAFDGSSRPTLDAPDLRDLARRHDDDLVSGGKAAGLDASRYNAAVIEFVDRLHRQPQRKRFKRACRLKGVERLDHGRTAIPPDFRRVLGNAVAVAR